MNASLRAVLNDSERLLVDETEPAALALLDEDAAIALHARIQRARNKYLGQYRRQASARVPAKGGRGIARPKNRTAAMKAEAFEEALSRVSRRVSVLARASAAELRAERLEAAAAAKRAGAPAKKAASAPTKGRTVAPKRTGDRSVRSAASENRRAGTLAKGQRRQAKRDSR